MAYVKKKRGPVRQFSLQCDSPKVSERRRSLKKQFSDEIVEISQPRQEENGVNIRISLSAKGNKTADRPPPVKVAWSDNEKKKEEGIVAKKCSEIKRPNTTSKLVKQRSLERDSILYSKQEIAQRMRRAWQEREKSKHNLKIFLAHSSKEIKNDDELSSDSSRSEPPNNVAQIIDTRTPKIMLPLQPDILNSDTNMKNVFQKHIRKTVNQKTFFSDSCYSPTRTTNDKIERSTTIVVPVVTNKTLQAQLERIKPLQRQNSLDSSIKQKIEDAKDSEIKQDPPSRPSTAASRRELFQKRTNSAFNSSIKKENSNFRPPLVRASSVPLKPEPPKAKFVATKRRVKTAKAKVRIGKGNDNTSEDDNSSSSSSNKRSWLQRCVSVSGCDVETMVSLVSPSGSENEEEPPVEKKEKPAKPEVSPIKPTLVKQESQQIDDAHFSLRKTVKSVTFQHSSIHAIRSFSASFPARRGSVATSLFLNSTSSRGGTQTQKVQEKRAPISAFEDEERVPKRRLVRTKSAPHQRSVDKENVDVLNKENEAEPESLESASNFLEDRPDIAGVTASKNESGEAPLDKAGAVDASPAESVATATSTSAPNFENPKERQCWDMYCKMSEKGVTVSFDTILRGMLTPTEYRLRRRPSASVVVPDDNCEIAEN